MSKLNFKIINLREEDILLDAGTGYGSLLNELAPYCKRIYGIEKNKIITSKIEKKHSNIILINKDLKKIRYYKKFNKIFCLEVLEHSDEPERILKNLRTALKDEGVLVVSVPTLYTEKVYNLINKDYNHNNNEHISIFSKEEWRRIFKKQGFKIKRLEHKNCFPAFYWTFYWLLRLNKKNKVDSLSGKIITPTYNQTKTIKGMINKFTFNIIEKFFDQIYAKSWYFYLEK